MRFALDVGLGKFILYEQSGIGWFCQRAKSETQVFPTFLFAGTVADIAQLTAYES
jgi:hypothetical protein